jgi:carboxylate-amine ligase
VVRARRLAAEAAEREGLVTVASGTVPRESGEPRVTRDDRYLAMLGTYGEIARPGGTCGMHVHVHVLSDEEGVTVIDALAPWLPVVLAISANSPFDGSRDTAYASWRSQLWSRWPSAGPTERFGSVGGYREVSRRLIATGAARDPGMLYFDARLSADHPTVEVRVSDVCTDVDDGMLIAALLRAMVVRVAAGRDLVPPGHVPWRAELLRAAHWRAARYGLADRLVHPTTGDLAPAREVLDGLVAVVREELDAYGDLAVVDEGVGRVLAGTGAVRQRAAFERSDGSLEAVVDDLAERTRVD